MILNEYILTSTPYKKKRQITSVSTKITTAIWSPDHTSRPPSSLDDESQTPIHESLYSLQLNRERLMSFRKYFQEIQSQLQNNSEIAMHKIQIKKNEILASIEFKFQACINEIKARENYKQSKISKDMKDVVINLKKTEEIIDRILNNLDVDEAEISHLLSHQCKKPVFEDNWLEIDIKDLQIVESPKKHHGKNQRTCSIDYFTSVRSESRSQLISKRIISTLFVDELIGKELQENSKIQLYVPYGSPPYSCFYLLTIPSHFRVKSLISTINKDIQEMGEIALVIKDDKDDKGKELDIFEVVPRFSVNGWPKLYLKFKA